MTSSSGGDGPMVPPQPPAHGDPSGDEKGSISRRTAMKGIGATLGIGAFAASVAPLRHLAEDLTAEEFMQRHSALLQVRQIRSPD